MKEKNATSYLDEIGANREAIGYDLEQVGLAHEQEVASENNWGGDQRDAVGRAASIANRKRRLAKKLFRISRELEAIGKIEAAEEMADDYKTGVEEMADDPMAMEMGEGTTDVADKPQSKEEWLDPSADTDAPEVNASKKEADHPLTHDPERDDPGMHGSTQMGDDEWISIGPGSFQDRRDESGHAVK
jgi:hypothetical protein